MSRRVEQLGVGYYKLKINDAGTIELNAGATGNITVVGNLNVSGNTTTVSSTNLEINDNTITLNKGESGSGVSLNTSGFVVDRGGLADAKLLFDKWSGTLSCYMKTDLHTAIDHAMLVSENEDTILLSPACASYDQYESFLRRGDDFINYAKENYEKN